MASYRHLSAKHRMLFSNQPNQEPWPLETQTQEAEESRAGFWAACAERQALLPGSAPAPAPFWSHSAGLRQFWGDRSHGGKQGDIPGTSKAQGGFLRAVFSLQQ